MYLDSLAKLNIPCEYTKDKHEKSDALHEEEHRKCILPWVLEWRIKYMI